MQLAAGQRIFMTALMAALILGSCTVQKRRYQKGFYVAGTNGKVRQPSSNTLHDQRHRSPLFSPQQAQEQPVFAAAGGVDLEDIGAEAAVRRGKMQQDSCDVLILSTGEEIRVRVSEITPSEVKYRKCAMADGPVFVTRKTEVFMIRYANGTKEVFERPAEAAKPAPVQSRPSAAPGQPVEHPNAVLTLVLGITGIVLGLGSIPAIVIGYNALHDIRKHPGKYTGHNMIQTGIVLGWIKLALLFMLIFFITSSIWW